MSLYVTSINSGSNGNCYYVGNGREAVLIDAGISCREIERRMTRLGLSIPSIKAIFISHEHSDHIKGLCRLSLKYRIPVYINQRTLTATGFFIAPELLHLFHASDPIQIGDFQITPFAKYHDAADPYSFVVEGGSIRIGVFTDIGRVCERVQHHFSQCHAVFLEANYDDDLLDRGRYPYFLKNRIRGGYGHLSNKQALELFLNHRTDNLSHLFLSHLSKDNNCPNLVTELFSTHANGVKIVVASRYEESPIFEVKRWSQPADLIPEIPLFPKTLF
ncbi:MULTISPECIES: MBL fold metallo-hydrolase [Olivibacter]|jgi:phosphoribosyl 1,2-cyclic phosphodiesterase|uniref:MBL fold metallo-hydrolase n=2 Tax=Olivibacter TaxID=376469 RepID=A0ABV6HDA9_9SPHI|nr:MULTISPECIES: MBL fold metallo-hydrolase [Olivibacter]MDM8178067.1 MBL fold metallo-hydrolase [Olivibacter sp. 47]MDX3916413.1 MBL fold metallo-hydrolase [Pseudosphingobacterium sp.]QEK99369.1 MBL fold metallo-hydrolase [Olivibacter sp. LS-1]